MTIVGLDDTDSRTRGMCTTYLAARLAEAIAADGAAVHRRLLVRLNPAVEHKTRGNAALALHTDLDAEAALERARAELEPLAELADPRTSPGVVVADCEPGDVPPEVADFARDAVREFHDLDDALAVADDAGFAHEGWRGDDPTTPVGRGRIGALAAVGAFAAFDDWTYEQISYREFDRCGTPRDVDVDSVFAAADAAYPDAWDTVDHGEGAAVCVPNAPGPILHGVRGDAPDACRRVAAGIDGEPVERTALFLTNQGTDAHLRPGEIGGLRDGRAYRVDGVVAGDPETREGGHVFVPLQHPEHGDGGTWSEGDDDAGSKGDDPGSEDTDAGSGADARTLACVAFEPTKRFRNRVRALRPGDRLTVCGEVSERHLKLEKFAVRGLNRTAFETPDCPDCGRSMKSAGRGQGYRCRDCDNSAPGKVAVAVDRDLELGWYEVPPCARRHIAKPLVRGGFDAPTHPER